MYNYNICSVYTITSPTGVPSSPVLTYESTLDEILLSWSPVGSDTVCGPVTYNITVMPSHGMIMMINDTVYNITGLYYNTNYTITVLASNNAGDGVPATVTVKTPPGILYAQIFYLLCISLFFPVIYVCTSFQVSFLVLAEYTKLSKLLYSLSEKHIIDL